MAILHKKGVKSHFFKEKIYIWWTC